MVTAVAAHLSAATQDEQENGEDNSDRGGSPGWTERKWLGGGRCWRSVMDNGWQKEIREKSKLTKRVSGVKKSSHN